MRENVDQNNCEYGHFLHSVISSRRFSQVQVSKKPTKSLMNFVSSENYYAMTQYIKLNVSQQNDYQEIT